MAPSHRATNKAIDEWLKRLPRVTEQDWAALLAAFPHSAVSTLRKAVRRSGLTLAALVEGVRQESFEELRRTLCALQAEYESALAAQDQARMKAIRERVIEAKTHARFAARRSSNRPEREEMIEWMLVWLNDPKLFDAWVSVRNRRAGHVTDPDADEADSDR